MKKTDLASWCQISPKDVFSKSVLHLDRAIFKWAERVRERPFLGTVTCVWHKWTSHGGESATQLLEYHATLDEREWTNHNGCCCVQATQSLLSPPSGTARGTARVPDSSSARRLHSRKNNRQTDRALFIVCLPSPSARIYHAFTFSSM